MMQQRGIGWLCFVAATVALFIVDIGFCLVIVVVFVHGEVHSLLAVGTGHQKPCNRLAR